MLVFRERALEAKVDKAAEAELDQDVSDGTVGGVSGSLVVGADGAAAVVAAAKSIESVKGGEMLMVALDLVEAELPAFLAMEAAGDGLSGPQHKAGKQQYRNPLLLGLNPYMYMLRSLRAIKAPDLEQALLVLPFHYVARLISMLIKVHTINFDSFFFFFLFF